MRICFVGLGSIGRRHLYNLSSVLSRKGVEFTIDALRSGHHSLPSDIEVLVNRQYYDIEELPDDYDIAFICTPTANHYSDIKQMLVHTRHMFIEKPVFDRIYDLGDLNLKTDTIYYVACPLRYNAVLQYLKKYVKDKGIYAVRSICSSYLPEWRPGVDYRSLYSAHRVMGGGVSIDLIHEWDYLCWLFGFPQNVISYMGTYSKLEIDSDDLALYLARYKEKMISVHLDYFGQSYKREIELFLDEDTVIGDIGNARIHFLKTGEIIDFKEDRNVYQLREIEHFLDLVEGKYINDSSIIHAQTVLQIAKGEY